MPCPYQQAYRRSSSSPFYQNQKYKMKMKQYKANQLKFLISRKEDDVEGIMRVIIRSNDGISSVVQSSENTVVVVINTKQRSGEILPVSSNLHRSAGCMQWPYHQRERYHSHQQQQLHTRRATYRISHTAPSQLQLLYAYTVTQ